MEQSRMKRFGLTAVMVIAVVAALGFFLLVDGLGPRYGWAERFAAQPRWVRWPAVYALMLAVLIFGEFNLVEFYYFQF